MPIPQTPGTLATPSKNGGGSGNIENNIISPTTTTLITGSYTITTLDKLVILTTNAGGVVITMPLNPAQGTNCYVKDGVGNVHTNNITINGNGKNIDGISNFTMNQNFSSILLAFNGVQWNII